MSEKKHKEPVEDIINKWKEAGITFNFKISYTDHADQDKWPITLWDRDGWPCDTDWESFELIVGNFISDYGLTQGLLCNTYREYSGDISVSRIRRE